MRHEVEVDTRIEATYVAWQQARVLVGYEVESVRRAAGQKRDEWTRERRWNGTLDEAVAKLEALGDERLLSHGKTAAQVLGKLNEVRDAADTAEQTYREANQEYEGWSRFFLVVGGHIHSSLECSTCYVTTVFGWLPALSGLNETDAVAEYGSVLCSVCFPSAPVDHVGGKSDGLTVRERNERKAERDAEKAERAAKKAAKTLEPELQFVELGSRYERYKDRQRYHMVTTVAAAKQQLRDAHKEANGFGYGGSRREHAAAVVADAERALLAKGMTQDELTTLKARALKQAQRDGF